MKSVIAALLITVSCICELASAENAWKFAVLTDSQGPSSEVSSSVNTVILSEIVGAVINEDVDLVIFSGDLVYGHPDSPENFEGQLTLWRDTMQPLYDAGIGVYPIRGNHDSHESYSRDIWEIVFSGPYALPGNGPPGQEYITYSFEHKNAFIIGLDLYTVGTYYISQAWLDAQLAANEQPHVFVYAHAPAFEVENWVCFGINPTERDTFWQSITAGGARTYFCGHDHFCNHARIDDGDGNPNNDLHQLVTGPAGGSRKTWDGSYDGNNSYWTPQLIYYESEYGYTLVEIDGYNVTTTWKHRTGPNTFVATSEVFSYTVPAYSGGSGVPSDPYLISTAEDMNEIGTNPSHWGKCFLLIDNIDMSGYTGTQFNIIGTNSKTPFSGFFDGNGHTISNFTYTVTDTNYIGIFGYVKTINAEIKDLTLINPNVDAGTGEYNGSLVGRFDNGKICNCSVRGGTVSGHSDTGGMVGFCNTGTISNCFTTCTVSGDDDTGGLMGATLLGTISNCHTTGNVFGYNDTGGLMGDNDRTVVSKCSTTGDISGHNDTGGMSGDNDWGTFLNCYATGNVVTDGTQTGGFIGEHHEGTISNCYAAGSVSGYSETGGLVGINQGGMISNSYAVGAVSGALKNGGLVATNDAGTTVASFWDTQTSNQMQSAGGIGKITADMQTMSTFSDAGWDFIEIWNISEKQTYPFLLQHPAGDINHDGGVDFFDLAILTNHWLEGVEYQPTQLNGPSNIAHWKMDDNEYSTTVLDSSGNGNNGTFNDAGGDPNTDAHHTDGIINGALTFDGTDDYIDFGDIALSGDFTVSAWIKPSSFSATILGDADNMDWIRLDTATNFVMKWDNIWFSLTHGHTFTTGEWQHFALVRENNVVSIYRNEVAPTTTVSQSQTFTPEFIGQKSNSDYFNGSIDNLMIFDEALTQEEIEAL